MSSFRLLSVFLNSLVLSYLSLFFFLIYFLLFFFKCYFILVTCVMYSTADTSFAWCFGYFWFLVLVHSL